MYPSGPEQDNLSDGVALKADEPTQAKEALEESEHWSPSPVDDAERNRTEKIRFQAKLLDAVGQAVMATDPQGKVIYWNRAAEELYGWSAEEVMGRSILEVTPSEEMLEQAEEIMSALRAGES